MLRTITCAGLMAFLALGGCASLSKNQCLANDWETVGYRDGLSGTPSSALLQHQDACVKHGVIPDRNAYLAGWSEGVDQYCQPANGFAVGHNGVAYSNVCPAHLQSAFYAAYQDGQHLYLARTEVVSIQHAISQREQRLRQVKSELAGIAGGMLDGESTTADRATLLLNAKDLAEEQGQLNAEIDELEVELAMKSEHLEALRQSLAYAG